MLTLTQYGVCARCLTSLLGSSFLLAACHSVPVASPMPAAGSPAVPGIEEALAVPPAPLAPPMMQDSQLDLPTPDNDLAAEAAERRGDYDAAREAWQVLADAGHAKSQYRLARLLEEGKGGPPNPAAALSWFKRAAENAYPAAHCRAAALLLRPPDADPVAALAHARSGAEAGETACMPMLATLLLEGPAAQRKPAEGLRWLAQAAETGDAESQFRMGDLLRSGRQGVARDLPRARQWLALAADEGKLAKASQLLAHLYETGLGGKRDAAMAARYYAQAAAAGLGESVNRLGMFYRHGNGVDKDPARAAALFTRALALDVAEAAVNLGDLYFLGLGVPRDYSQAMIFYGRAAERGVPSGLCRQSAMLRFGEGVVRDLQQAQQLEAKVRARIPTANCRIPLAKLLHP